MSSAILYAAIVAIWAGVLIPRWLRRDTSQASRSSLAFAGDQPAGAGQDAHADGAETLTGDMAGEGRPAAGGDGGNQVPTEGGAAPAAARGDGAADLAGRGGGQAAGSGAERPDSRQRIVAARRRLLLILITLTVAALGIVGLKLASWWVAVPPVIMLGGYLVLLREASRADRERAVLDAAYRDEQRRLYAEQQAVEEPAAPAPPVVRPAARVIDISERVRDEDEIYDQYADGTRRAVGD